MSATFTRYYILFLSIATALYAVALLIPALRPFPAAYRPRADAPLTHSLEVVPASARSARPDYRREAFGNGWAPLGACTVRHAIIGKQVPNADGPARSLPAPEACILRSGEIFDPYAGKVVDFAQPREIEVDHVFPLAAAWDLGAHAWSASKREQFANDPDNLVATSRALNQDKLDQLPAAWMPPARAGHCWYATQLAAVAAKYQLALPAADQARMRRACWFRQLQLGKVA